MEIVREKPVWEKYYLISPEEANKKTDMNFDVSMDAGFFTAASGKENDSFNDPGWGKKGDAQGLSTLGRKASRASFIMFTMMADGYSFDSLFSASEEMAAARELYCDEALALLSGENNEKRIEEIYHRAGLALLDTKLPTIDMEEKRPEGILSPEERREWEQKNARAAANVDRAMRMKGVIKDYQQIQETLSEAFQSDSEHGMDHGRIDRARGIAEAYLYAVTAMGAYKSERQIGERGFKSPENLVVPKFYLDNSGEKLSGKTLGEAAKLTTLMKEGDLLNEAYRIELGRAELRAYVDSGIGSAREVAGFYANRRGCVYKRPSEDMKSLELDFGEHLEAYRSGRTDAIFDQLVKPFCDPVSEHMDDPEEHAEAEIKRFYIDGRNAYEELSERYQGDETAIKKAIVEEIASGKHRVEFVRMETGEDGSLHPVILPVAAKLEALDQTKKWYQFSRANAAEKLWSGDSQKDKRHEAILANAVSRQEKRLREALGLDEGYYQVLDAMEEIHRNAAKEYPDAARLEALLAENPAEVRSWISLKEKRDAQAGYELMERQLDGLIAGPKGETNAYLKTMNDFSRALGKLELPKELREDGEVSRFLSVRDTILRVHEEGGSYQAEDFKRDEESLLPGLAKLKKYVKEQKAESLSQEESEEIDRLDDKYLGCHKNKSSSLKEQRAYLMAEEHMAKIRDIRRKELAAAYMELAFLIPEDMNAKPEKTRSHIQRMDRICEQLQLGPDDIEAYKSTLKPDVRRDFENLQKWMEMASKQPDRRRLDKLPPVIGSSEEREPTEALAVYFGYLRNAAFYKMGYVDFLKADFDDKLSKLQKQIAECGEAIAKNEVKNAGGQAGKTSEEREFKLLFGVEFQEFKNSDIYKLAGEHMGPRASQPAAWNALTDAQLLADGMEWTRVRDREQRTSEERARAQDAAAKLVEIFTEPMAERRAERFGKLMVDCKKAVESFGGPEAEDKLGKALWDGPKKETEPALISVEQLERQKTRQKGRESQRRQRGQDRQPRQKEEMTKKNPQLGRGRTH